MPSVGSNIPHDSARGHASGESQFIDDIPPQHGELFVEVVGSPVAHGKIRAVHLEDARGIPGVSAVLTARDIPGHNKFGPIIPDEHLLADDFVDYIGDPIVLIAAETRVAAMAARKAVRLEIDPLPPIFSIDDAIEQSSFIGPKRTIETGDVDTALQSADHTLAGELVIGGQEHFYLESQAAVALPGEGGTITVHSSTQHPSEVQSVIAEILGLRFNHVVVQCKRMGGGFGGKETQSAQPAAMAALVAYHTRRPARLILNRDDDMAVTGKRHPFKGFYTVGFTREGRITALALDLYSNGGCSADLSPSVLERAMMHSDNAYFLANTRITGRVCKTNLPSNTAFRGFGGPQGVACIENILEEIAIVLQKDACDLRQLNCYGIDERNTAPYGQIIRNNVLPRLFNELRTTSAYDHRRAEITAFNAHSKTQLRGLSLTPVKFGISFTKRTLNQANALVNIYTDGTVLVTTGATEMGQGVHTRVRQLVADDLGVPYDSVLIGATSTDKNHNTSATAASSGTDLNGAAALDATGRLRACLADLAAPLLADSARGLPPSPTHLHFADGAVTDTRAPDRRISFKELVRRAYEERISLGERGFYITPGVDFNRETGKGTPFLYYTNGAAVSEVLIDRFTGQLSVPRVDLLMDVGVSINPGIDRGQITGGFIQGMGWVTMEELKYNDQGALLSHSPTTYKIPAISDVPAIFNVAFLDNPDNVVSLKRSKALGEPPLLLGLSVWAAIKNALSHIAPNRVPRLSIPATNEHILMILTDLSSLSAPAPALSSAAVPTQTPK